MKPAGIIGTEDRILNRWAQFAKKYNFLPLIGDGTRKYVVYLSSNYFDLQPFILYKIDMCLWFFHLAFKCLFLEIFVNSDKWCYCRIQPVYVVDVAGALVAALKDDGTSMGKIYELGGPDVFTVHELVIFAFISLLLNDMISFQNKN